jgi:hypothetical protein
LFVIIKWRWMPLCAIIRIYWTAQCGAVTVESASSRIPATGAAEICGVSLAVDNTIVAS